jgi:predicted metal-dependent RNase
MTLRKSGYMCDIKGKTVGTVEEKHRWANAVYRFSTINYQTIRKINIAFYSEAKQLIIISYMIRKTLILTCGQNERK